MINDAKKISSALQPALKLGPKQVWRKNKNTSTAPLNHTGSTTSYSVTLILSYGRVLEFVLMSHKPQYSHIQVTHSKKSKPSTDQLPCYTALNVHPTTVTPAHAHRRKACKFEQMRRVIVIAFIISEKP